MREIMEDASRESTCNACHGVMDPLGFSLENFDTIGAYRAMDRFTRTKIDTSGKLVDGTAVNGPSDLRNALLPHPEQFVQTLTEKLMTYALGRGIEYYDMPSDPQDREGRQTRQLQVFVDRDGDHGRTRVPVEHGRAAGPAAQAAAEPEGLRSSQQGAPKCLSPRST